MKQQPPTCPPEEIASAPGCVTLVGAGPGDPELLTLKAVKAIAQATLLFVDDLVDDAVLVHASADARVVRVGKRGGCRSTPQAFIHKSMVAAARAGHQVVRLKGGDPLIFGRGGEEMEHLRAAGIEVRVVNGITAGLAALTLLGAPLTHRERAHGVLLLAGHAGLGQPVTDWPTIAALAQRARLTLVVYMGVRQVHDIQEGLLQGLPASTPAAVVEHATLPHQRQVVTVLGELAQEMKRLGLGSPAVIVVGDVVQGALAWRQSPERNSALPLLERRA